MSQNRGSRYRPHKANTIGIKSFGFFVTNKLVFIEKSEHKLQPSDNTVILARLNANSLQSKQSLQIQTAILTNS